VKTRRAPVQVSWGCELLTSHERVTPATPEQIWRVLADGWLFPRWAIGATQIRSVDGDWPTSGSRLHHAIGHGRLAWRSETRVLASTPARLLKMRVDGWPTGGSELTVTLEPVASGTSLRIDELVVAGPDHVLPPTVHTMLLQWRNTEALRGLALLAEAAGS
jgi:uncharacterized protein YndB with AHSA1/START domain